MRAQHPKRVARDVGRRIAELRRELGATQQAFSERADVSLKYLQRVEAGSENLTIESLVKFGTLLRVDVIELFRPPQSPRGRPGRPARTRAP